MTPAEETHAAAAYGETFEQAFECNIPEIYGEITLVCDYLTGAEGWLTNYRIDREAGLLSVKVPANPTAPRSARIALRYDDGEGGGYHHRLRDPDPGEVRHRRRGRRPDGERKGRQRMVTD